MRKIRGILTVLMVIIALPVLALAKNEEEIKTVEAKSTQGTFILDGEEVSLRAYKINRSNYYKIRDLAALLKDSQANFAVEYDQANQTVTITPGKSQDQDLTQVKDEEEKVYQVSLSPHNMVGEDGQDLEIKAYLIEESNYIRVEDIADLIKLGLSYKHEESKLIIDTTNPDLEDIVDEDYYKAPINKIQTEGGQEEISFLIYGFDQCPHCANLKNYLDEKKIQYLMRDIRDIESKKDEVFAQFYPHFEGEFDRVYYPTTVISLEKDGKTIEKGVLGFKEENYDQILESIKNNTYFVEED